MKQKKILLLIHQVERDQEMLAPYRKILGYMPIPILYTYTRPRQRIDYIDSILLSTIQQYIVI
jgi:hypothetical protein